MQTRAKNLMRHMWDNDELCNRWLKPSKDAVTPTIVTNAELDKITSTYAAYQMPRARIRKK